LTGKKFNEKKATLKTFNGVPGMLFSKRLMSLFTSNSEVEAMWEGGDRNCLKILYIAKFVVFYFIY
jgi:hypothetical protein